MNRPPRLRRTETPVVPLHAHRPPHSLRTVGGLAIAEPRPRPVPLQEMPSGPASTSGARARRATAERQAHDGWTLVVVPPGVGARPRTLFISTRRFRLAAASLATLVGTTVVCGGLLAVFLSFAPVTQDESAGVQLGLFGEIPPAAPQTVVPPPTDLLSLLAIGPAAATVYTPLAPRADSALPAAPRRESAPGATAARRRVVAAPSMSGRREATVSMGPIAVEGLPVIGRITSRFTTSRRHPLLGVVRAHKGVDIAASTGTPITAPAPGRVIYSGRKFGFGNVVEVDHGHGIVTRYAHCNTLRVKVGAEVETGTLLATVGRTGLASGPHLHFEVLVDGRSVDPLKQQVPALLASRTPAPSTPLPVSSAFVPSLPASGADSLHAPAAGDSSHAGAAATGEVSGAQGGTAGNAAGAGGAASGATGTSGGAAGR